MAEAIRTARALPNHLAKRLQGKRYELVEVVSWGADRRHGHAVETPDNPGEFMTERNTLAFTSLVLGPDDFASWTFSVTTTTHHGRKERRQAYAGVTDTSGAWTLVFADAEEFLVESSRVAENGDVIGFVLRAPYESPADVTLEYRLAQ